MSSRAGRMPRQRLVHPVFRSQPRPAADEECRRRQDLYGCESSRGVRPRHDCCQPGGPTARPSVAGASRPGQPVWRWVPGRPNSRLGEAWLVIEMMLWRPPVQALPVLRPPVGFQRRREPGRAPALSGHGPQAAASIQRAGIPGRRLSPGVSLVQFLCPGLPDINRLVHDSPHG